MTVDEYCRALDAWKRRPWWRRFRGKPIDSPTTVDNELVGGVYDDLAAAEQAAGELAGQLDGQEPDGVGVSILSSDGEEVGGRWLNGDSF